VCRYWCADIGVQISFKTLWRQNGTSQGFHLHQKTQIEKWQTFINASSRIPSKDPNFRAVNLARYSDEGTNVTKHFVATCVSGHGVNNFGSECRKVAYFLCTPPNYTTKSQVWISARRFSIRVFIDYFQTNTRIIH